MLRGVDLHAALAALPDGVITLHHLRATGRDAAFASRAARAGRLRRVRPGCYVRAPQWESATTEQRHRWLVEATGSSAAESPVFSHESAAALWGLPVVEKARDLAAHVVEPWRGGGTARVGRRTHVDWDGMQVVEQDGVRLTSAADTVLALARDRPFIVGVAVADAALRRGLVTRAALDERNAATASKRGARRAALVTSFADERAESPGESISRARIHELGLAAPELQTTVADGRGPIGRVDFWWPGARVVGEFDGRVKYRTDGVDDRRRVEDRLWDEKLREDRLRAVAAGFSRWTWATVWDPPALARRLVAAGVPRGR